MLQGRDSENSKVVAKSMTQGERNKLLKTLRNRHTNWQNSRSEDSQVLYTILQEGKKKHMLHTGDICWLCYYYE